MTLRALCLEYLLALPSVAVGCLAEVRHPEALHTDGGLLCLTPPLLCSGIDADDIDVPRGIGVCHISPFQPHFGLDILTASPRRHSLPSASRTCAIAVSAGRQQQGDSFCYRVLLYWVEQLSGKEAGSRF